MKNDDNRQDNIFFLFISATMVVLFCVLGIRLKELQIDNVADYREDNNRQSIRRVQIPGERGRILDCKGRVLATNGKMLHITVRAEAFQAKNTAKTITAISNAVKRLEKIIGRAPDIDSEDLARHIRLELSLSLPVWKDITTKELAVFSEHQRQHPGFQCEEEDKRIYCYGREFCHLLGRVGRGREIEDSGDTKINFGLLEMRGREGVEYYYDSYLRGTPGEDCLLVDARGFTNRRWTSVEAIAGPDLTLTVDSEIQNEAYRQLKNNKGACVVMDPYTGAILALASEPSYDVNKCIPVFSQDYYRQLKNDEDLPLLNRATAGTFAPGSTFKPIVALAGLDEGVSPEYMYECYGIYEFGLMTIRCTRRWGHGGEDIRHALRDSCNPYFCNLGMSIGTNAVINAAKRFGLGKRTGIDFPTDAAGVVPDGDWKRQHYGEKWYAGDLAQMSIGQGMLLVTPLQMARVVGAIGTGHLVKPHLMAGMPVEEEVLPFSSKALQIVREGMRMVVDGGTGKAGGDGVNAWVIGKTGTAEIGRGEKKRKNTWFIAFAAEDNGNRMGNVRKKAVAIALIIENGKSGGATAAPKVCQILKSIFNREEAKQ